MPSASAPFQNKTPFHSRVLGLDYQAFGIDFVNPPYADFTASMSVSPSTQFSLSGGCNVPYAPGTTNIYTITNPGRRGTNWTAASSVPWISLNHTSGVLAGLDSIAVTATVSADALAPSNTPYVGTITFTNLTNGIGNVTAIVSLTKQWPGSNDDDFESYPLGLISSLTHGNCWGGDGTFALVAGYYAFDDFEAYALGAITTMVYGSGWSAAGSFGGYQYLRAYDAFESYPTGSIIYLTFTASDSLWSGNGFFQTYPT